MSKKAKINYVILITFFVYFLVLMLERLHSISSSLANNVKIFEDGFSGFTYLTLSLSVIVFIVYLIIRCRDAFYFLFKPGNGLETFNFKNLIFSAGILLVSGMVHTTGTVAPMQFVAYGVLIVGLFLKTVLNNQKSNNRLLLWFSFVYLVCFSMAIPVAYEYSVELATLIHGLEGAAVFLLVASFTCMTLMLFNEKDDLFNPAFIILALIFGIPIIILGWNDPARPYIFFMIFLIASVALYLAGLIIKFVKRK